MKSLPSTGRDGERRRSQERFGDATQRPNLRYLLWGLWLVAVEAGWVLFSARDLFLGWSEIARYLVTATALLPALVWLAAQGGRLVLDMGSPCAQAGGGRGVFLRVAALSVPTLAWAGWLLTDGRRLREWSARPLLVGLVAVAAGSCIAWLARRLHAFRASAQTGWHRTVAVAGAAVAALGLVLDRILFVRSYPALHWLLVSAAVLGACLVGVFADGRRPARMPRRLRESWWVMGWLAGAVWLGTGILHAPNLRLVLMDHAPLSGKLIALGARAVTASSAFPDEQAVAGRVASGPAVAGMGAAESGAGKQAASIDLRGGDVLLITVDALRADYLAPYGGAGHTPALDALADESAVFLRAYTPTPHTSYALASLMTGKFLRPVMSLPQAPTQHTLLTDLLRRYGHRTAAFYPPAIFFVDSERFEYFKERGLGFEYGKAMFASAFARVEQLDEYLQQVQAGKPVFVWVHLFEPHEPYNPPAGFERGSSPEARYRGEVEATDAAIGKLVALFRSQRPGATVIVTADHGEEFGDHGGHYHGSTLYDEQVRVPLLWSSPGIVEPRRVEVPVETIDIATTLLAALGIPRDARMRGDDLGGLLHGSTDRGPEYAFAELADARMVTDGRYKAICRLHTGDCQLFDLQRDPRERRNLAIGMPDVLRRLQGALAAFVASIPRHEIMALDDVTGWPEALARAELGDPAVAERLVPLLGHDSSAVRAHAARAIGMYSHVPALPIVARLSEVDPDPAVREEAALAMFALQCPAQHACDAAAATPSDALVSLVQSDAIQPPNASRAERQHRAALALVSRGDGRGAPLLIERLSDPSLAEERRAAVIDALAGLEYEGVMEALLPLLAEVRLRARVAAALGRQGDPRAVAPLRAMLGRERHVEVREAGVRALLALGDTAYAVQTVQRFLGMASSIPNGVAMLSALDALERPPALGVHLASAPQRRVGAWVCAAEDGCAPGTDAGLRLPRSRQGQRLVLRLDAGPGDTSAAIQVGDLKLALGPGVQEVNVRLGRGRFRQGIVPIAATGAVRIVAAVVVPHQSDALGAESWQAAGTAPSESAAIAP